MQTPYPRLIQGGMGVGVSSWPLAQVVSRLGQLGVVSGTGLDQIMARRLQDGNQGGHIRRALDQFPLRAVAGRILETLHIPGGKAPNAPYRPMQKHTMEGRYWPQALCVAANFVEVFLAREGHPNPVGINYLEKIQLPHLPSLYGAMLAGVGVVIVGAGIPAQIPGVLDLLADHQPVTYWVDVSGMPHGGGETRIHFDPRAFHGSSDQLTPLPRPDFLPIVSSATLAAMLCRRDPDGIAGFVVEGSRAGGHNAPPRGQLRLSARGEPVYGPRDAVNLDAMRKLGRPFWLAGSYGSPERVREALAQGAAGVQVGTAFALCAESGIVPEVRRALIGKALAGDADVFTDAAASPTGFPFKVAALEGTLSDADLYQRRRRVCDLGFLREAYRRKADGRVGYRCPAEPESAFVAKGGTMESTIGRKCLCNALVANVGMPQRLADGTQEPCLITLGDDFAGIGRFCTRERPDYTAADVIRVLLG